MASAEEMRLVFRLGGVGFALPISQLLEIVEPAATRDASFATATPGPQAGLFHRGEWLPLRDLSRRLDLVPRVTSEAMTVLALTGADGPWCLQVDAVAGIHPAAGFVARPAPVWMFQPGRWPFRRLLLWRGEPLVQVEVSELEACWDAAQ